MSTMVSQITSLTIVYLTVYSGTDERKHQSSMSLAFVRGIHRWPVNSLHKAPVMRKLFPFDDVIMLTENGCVKILISIKFVPYAGIILCMCPTNERHTGIILCICPTNEGQCYNVTVSLIGWVHTQNDPCLYSSWQLISIVFGNGVAPNWCQAIAKTNWWVWSIRSCEDPWGRCHKRYLCHQLLKLPWKLLIQLLICIIELSQGPMNSITVWGPSQ